MTATIEQHYERLREQVGSGHTEQLGTIERRDLLRFAVATGASDGVGLPGDEPLVAPPLFLSSVMAWGAGPPVSELGTDGSGGTRGITVDGLRLMGAGQDLQFHAPVLEGTTVIAHTILDDVKLKPGRTGPLLILRLRRQFTDDHERPLVTCHESFIAR